MTPDESLWQRLEADFARVLGEIPKPVSPAQREALDELTREAQERGEYGEVRER